MLHSMPMAITRRSSARALLAGGLLAAGAAPAQEMRAPEDWAGAQTDSATQDVLAGAKLIVFVVGDEAGEGGDQLAKLFRNLGYEVSAMALLLSLAQSAARGTTVRTCAAQLEVPFSEVSVDSFTDPYQVPRVLKALLDAPAPQGLPGTAPKQGWVERVMSTKLLALPT